MKLIRKPSHKDGWYEITPGDAQEILDTRAPNRSINERRASAIAEEIKDGRFTENGETLIFDKKRCLIDGQHRLRAVVLANKAIVSYCVHEVSDRAFATIDDCSKRTASDVLGIAGYQNAVVAAGVARLFFKYENGLSLVYAGKGPLRVSNRVIAEVMKKNKDINEAVSFVVTTPGLRNVLPPSVSGFGYLMARRQDEKKAAEFFTKLGSGEQLHTGSPILTLRNRFIAMVGEKHRIKQWEAVALMIKAWNAFFSGKEMKLARYSGKAANERFPRFGEDQEE